MRRKVVQIAGFTKVVSLPSQWVKKNGIEKGDELEVSERGNFLLVSANHTAKKLRRAHIDASKLNTNVIWPLLSMIHKTGYDEIKVTGTSKEMMRIIHDKVSSSLLGFEVIEQMNDYCIIKNIAEGMPTNLQSVLRKVFLVTLSQARQCLEFVKTNDKDVLNEVLKLEDTNDKLTNFSERLLNDEAITLENRYDYFIVWLLENVGDGYRLMCSELKDEKIMSIDSSVVDIFVDVNARLEEFYALFYKFSMEAFSGFNQSLVRTTADLNKVLRVRKGADAVVLSHLSYILRTLHDSMGASIYLKAELESKIR
jgi:phosphate uptake regulator